MYPRIKSNTVKNCPNKWDFATPHDSQFCAISQVVLGSRISPKGYLVPKPKVYFQAMKFDLVDQVLEQSEDRIVTVKQVTQSEEYLADHFPGFPSFYHSSRAADRASTLSSRNESKS